MPAGTGLDRRQFLLRSAGLVLTVYGAIEARRSPRSRRASRPPRRRDRVLVSVFMAGGIDSLSVLAPVGDPNYRKLRPKLALADSDGTPFGEDGRLRWHPSAAGPRDAARRGQGHASCRRSATTIPTSRTSTPATSTRWARSQPQLVTGWMGRYLDRVGTHGQPAPGPDPERRPRARRWRPRACPWRRSRARATTTSGRPACGER